MLLYLKSSFLYPQMFKKGKQWIFIKMNAFDVMSVDVVAAKDNANVIEISTRLA